MKRSFHILLFFLAATGQAQVDLDRFTPLESQGVVPQDLISFYIKDSENNSRQTNNDFIQHNTVEFGNLFASGKVIFNDPLSTYAKKVLDTLLFRQPVVRNKIRIYTLKSAVTNAYTTNDGKIFITTGLFARLQNEAQLAFILSHEIIHYLNNHAYETFVFNSRVDRKKRRVDNETRQFDDVLLTKFRHSRANEYEADKQGLILFLQSEYSTAVIDSVFAMLDYSELPVQNIPFDRSFFETPYFHIRNEAWLNPGNIEPVNIDPDFKESKSTHPNSKSRKSQIQSVLDKSQNIGAIRKLFLFPEDEFSSIHDIALFDLSNVYYLDHNYEDGIYNSWLLLKRFPDNLYLRKTISRCLNGLLAENSYRMGLYDSNKKRGYISQLAHLIHYCDRDELETMALIFTWKIYKQHADDYDLKILLNKFFSYIDEKDPAFFYRKATADLKLAELKNLLSDSLKSKGNKEVIKQNESEVLRRSGFADLMDNPEFSAALQQSQLSKTPFKIPEVKLDNNKMFVIPLVYVIDSSGTHKRYTDPQKVVVDYSKQLSELGPQKNVQFTFLSTYDLKPGDVDKYNEYSMLSQWVSVNGEKDVQNYVDFEGMKKLGEKYKSKYLCLSGVYFYKNNATFKFRRWLLFTLLIPPGAGIIPGTTQLFTANYSAYYSTVVYDIETGKIVSRTYDANFNNVKPKTKTKKFWHTLKPWYEENVLQKEPTKIKNNRFR